MVQQEKFKKLIQQYADHSINKEAYTELMGYFNTPENADALQNAMDEVWQGMHTTEAYGDEEAFYARLIADKRFKQPAVTKRLWTKIAVAASILLVTGAGLWFYHPANAPLSSRPESRGIWDLNDIPPGGNRATLVIDGDTINLNDAKSGVMMSNNRFAYNDNTPVISNKERDLLNSKDKGIKNITAATPRGGMYQITLPDNTKVWLNNDSKLEFASNFGKTNQRIVELTGEAYFEVTKNKAMPFKVKSDGQETTVLGTHFNISAYKGEGIKTTLLEGSVRVASTLLSKAHNLSSRANAKDLNTDPSEVGMTKGGNGEAITLKPNQQSIVTGEAGITIKQVDAELAVAWKNNRFMFESESIENIMKVIARWYNVEVQYEGEIPNDKFGASVSKFDNVSTLLNMLERTKAVHFRIEGRKIIVSK